MATELRVLIVQSTLQDLHLVESVLAEAYGESAANGTETPQIICSATLENALDRLARARFNLIILSQSLPDSTETRFAIRMIREVSGAPVVSLCAPSGQLVPPGQLEDSVKDSLLQALAACTLKAQTLNRQQEETEEALHRLKVSEERYALAIEGVQDGIWDWDLELNSIHYSPQWKAMLGLAGCALTDSPKEWIDRVHPEDAALLRRSLEEHLIHHCQHFRCEYRIRHADGHYLWVLSRGGALWNAKGRAYRIVGSQIDIDYHKQLEASLAREKDQATAILKSMGDAVITTDAEGRIIDFNPEAEKLTGWSAEAAKNRPVSQVCNLIDGATRQPLESPSELVLKQGKVVSMSNHPTLISRQGSEVAIDESTAPIRDRNGVLIGTVLVFRDVSVERNRAELLAWQVSHDPLTGIANRQHFVERLEQASHKPGCSHVFCYLDLDHFKVVNDTCGHAAGDELLRQVSSRLSHSIRQSDLLARLGGDEFGLIIYDCSLEQAYAIARKLCDLIQKFRFLWEGKVFSIGVSIGLVPIPPEGAQAARLMSLADAACYAAKNKGRNQVQIYSEKNADVMQLSADFEWFSRITQAIEEDQFCLYSQEIKPQDPTQETIQEILLRLPNRRSHTLMPPMAFIPPAERYDLMPKLDQWTIRHCFKQLENVRTPGVLYSINLSGDTLNDDNFVDFLRATLSEFHVDPHRICFEITETTAIANLTQVALTMLNLKKLGFRFALDDFGSGMSSFVYLKQLPVDYLKIDGSLVEEINRDKVALATLKSINDIGHIMGLTTVAEYVSDKEILRTVQGLNVDYLQGFAIARPRPFNPTNRPPAVLASKKVAENGSQQKVKIAAN